MQSQSNKPYDEMNFRTNLSLAECLQRLEDYQNSKPGILNAKKTIIIIHPIKANEIYELEAILNQANYKVRLEADGDGCVIQSKVEYQWFASTLAGLFLFGIVCVYSKFSLSF